MAGATLVASGGAVAADWMQFGYDASHSGNNPSETQISPDNVAQLTQWFLAPSYADVAPVYLSNAATIAGTANLLFVISPLGLFRAINADTGSLLWSADTHTGCAGDIASSPAIDPNRAFVYAYGCDGKVHKYSIFDGTEILSQGWPQISTLKPNYEKGASALAIATDRGATHLYSVTNGYSGDGGDYQGHITTIDLESGDQRVFNTLCSDIAIHMVEDGQPGIDDCAQTMSGIWGRPGATYDPSTRRVYITTGNGKFDANFGGLNWGDSILALNPDGSGSGAGLPVDSYTPKEYDALDHGDTDLGSVSLAILPVPAGSAIQHVGLQTGKDGLLRLIDLDDMNGTGAPGSVGGEISITSIGADHTFPQPAVWTDTLGDGSIWTFVTGLYGTFGLKFVLDASNTPTLLSTWTNFSLRATSSVVANGVLYLAGACASSSYCLFALDPRTGGVWWTSPPIGGLHWASPILVNGSLFIAAGNGIYRFSLGEPPAMHVVSPTSNAGGVIAPGTDQSVFDGDVTSFTVTPNEQYTLVDVTGCGGSLTGNTYTTAPITADCTVSATFAIITHTVTPNAGDGTEGTIDPDTPQTVDDGETAIFTITPRPPYRIEGVSGCGGTLEGNTYTTGPITADCSVTAAFALDTADVLFRNGFDP